MSQLASPPPVRPRVAAAALASALVLTALEWAFPARWASLAAVVGITPTMLAACGSLAVSLALLAGHRGLVPSRRQLLVALVVGVATWLADQAAGYVDHLWSGPGTSLPMLSMPEAIATATAEEVVFRAAAIGGVLALVGPRVSAPRAIAIAVAASTLVFVVAHIPHDLVLLESPLLERYAELVGYGALLALVYLSTRNLALTIVLHALGDQPMVLIAGPHTRQATWAVDWIACLVVVSSCLLRKRACCGSSARP